MLTLIRAGSRSHKKCLWVRGLTLPPQPAIIHLLRQPPPNMKTSTEFVIIKECGNWIKTAKEVQKPINSWNGIIQMIDDIFDEAVEDYAILHKPFNLMMM